MGSKKKSFILHKDTISDILIDYNNEEKGIIFQAIVDYQNGCYDETDSEKWVNRAIRPLVSQFKRDDEKYVKTCEARAAAGSKGGKQKVANATNSKQKVANLADNDNDNDNDNDSVKDKRIDRDQDLGFGFNQFYNSYMEHSRLEADESYRVKSETAWKGLTEDERAKAIDTAASYASDKFKNYGDNMKYVQKPHTFLSNKDFNSVKPKSEVLRPVRMDNGGFKYYDSSGKAYHEKDVYFDKLTKTTHLNR